jgi:hypothetical protein
MPSAPRRTARAPQVHTITPRFPRDKKIITASAFRAVHRDRHAVERPRLIDPNAGSRLIGSDTAYYAIGTGGGAIAATIAYSASGWSAVCILGAGLSTLDS